MGHAAHFLSRLDRFSTSDTELALSLYRDDELVRYLLGNARTAAGAERVALSLDDPVEGPFIVVTGDGKFVTALGRGMRPSGLPVIARGQIDALKQRLCDHRGRLQHLDAEKESGRNPVAAMARSGHMVPREDFHAASALAPVLTGYLVKLAVQHVEMAAKVQWQVVGALRRADKLKGADLELARSHWSVLWGIGHLLLLAVMDGRERLAAIEADIDSLKNFRAWLASCGLRADCLGVAARGAWSAAKLGRDIVPQCKELLRDEYAGEAAMGALMLGAIGLRHARVAAEAHKAVQAAPAAANEQDRPWLQDICQSVAACLDDPEAALQRSAERGAQIAVSMARSLPDGAPHAYRRPEDVPRDVSLPLLCHFGIPLFNSGATALIDLLPFLAAAEAMDLYLPRDCLGAYFSPWCEGHSRALLTGNIAPQPAPPKGPSRGAPCPCGSGKKYKRCCGSGK